MSRRILYFLFLFLFVTFAVSAREKQRVWVIDAGHGGNDHGCESTTAMEKNITLTVAKRVAELVRANIPNTRVILTRETDKYLSLNQRCQIANRANADLFLSIHVNAAPELNYIRGTETFYGPLNGTKDRGLENLRKKNIQKSELMAWMMQKYYGVAGRPISRGVKRERYYVILYTKMPAILTEIGFISTPSEEKYMTSPAGQEEIAQSIYRGLKEYDETVKKDKIQSTLAKLRNSGGKVQQNLVPPAAGPEKLTPDAMIAQTSVPKVQPIAQDTIQQPVSKDPDTGVLAGTLEPEELDEPLLFSVQIFSLRAKLKPTDPRFKGLKDLLVVERDGLYKYLCGTTDNYTAARALLAEVRKTFTDAFLVAYKGGRQIPMADAIEMLPK